MENLPLPSDPWAIVAIVVFALTVTGIIALNATVAMRDRRRR
jgi:hypothetical protein